MTQDRMTQLRDFATRYTAAWCSRDAASVSTFFAPSGSLTINGGIPSVGRSAITKAAQGFMTAFPDLNIDMNDLVEKQGRILYQWTLEGTHRETGGRVRVSGFESWRIGADGLIDESLGNFDATDFERQITQGRLTS